MPEGGTLLVLGLGPIGDMSARIALHHGYRVIGVDLVPERLERARSRGAEVVDINAVGDVAETVRGMTRGRGADSVVESSATHRLPLSDAPSAYETFQKKDDEMVKVVFKP